MNRRAFLKTTASSAALLVTRPAWSTAETKTESSDDEILAQCKARIEQHRKSDGAIVLRDSRGQPVSHAKITIEQLRHDFLFGCNFFMLAGTATRSARRNIAGNLPRC